MSLFKDMLKDSESLFTDELALDPEFVPPVIQFRETQQEYIATCIKPLFQKRSGRNLLITGVPGIGKTLAVKHIFNELNKETDEIETIFINCWKQDTPYKIALEICDQLKYKWTINKNTSELIKEIGKILNKKSVVFCFDEIDKLTDMQIIYTLLEDIYHKTILMITNEETWLSTLDARVKSRLMPDLIKFEAYSPGETAGILHKRIEFAFVPNIWDAEALQRIIDKTSELKDIRAGLFLLKESGNSAEIKASRKIDPEHAESAIEKLKHFKIKSSDQLKKEDKELLKLLEGELTTKELYERFSEKKEMSYRNFLRKIDRLRNANLIEMKTFPGLPAKISKKSLD